MKRKECNGSNNIKSLIRNSDEFMNMILDIIENDNHKSHTSSLVNVSGNNKEIIDPITHIFDEGDKIIIVVQLSGIEEENINLEIDGNDLNITAEGPEKYYYKKITLRHIPILENISENYHNSIYSIEIKK